MAAAVSVPNTFHGVTNSHADNHDANNAALVAWLNANALHLDGSKAFTTVPSGPAQNPTSEDQLARKTYVDGVFTLTRVGVRRAVALSIVVSPSLPVAVTWDTEDFDSAAFIAAPSSTITIPAGGAGLYQVMFRVTNNTPSVNTFLSINDAVNTLTSMTSGGTADDVLSMYAYLAVGSVIRGYITNLAGSTRNFVARMTLVRLTT